MGTPHGTKLGEVDPSFSDFARLRSAAHLRTAYLLVGDHGHAEDLLQVALLRTARRWHAASRSPDAYVRATLVHLATDRWRQLLRRPTEIAIHDEFDAMALQDPCGQLLERTILVAALGELPIGQRTIIVLRFFEGLSVPETAAVLRCSEGTVKSHSSRALARMRELLAVDPSEVPCVER